MSKRPGYSPEVRERAVRMVLTGEHEHKSRWAAIQSVAAKIGCTPETLRSWVNKIEVDTLIKSLSKINRNFKKLNVEILSGKLIRISKK